MAKTYTVGEGGHLQAHNEMSQFIEDAEQGLIPELIGPEGPQGPEGPEGPEGKPGADGKTPKALHISMVSNPAAGGETDVPFRRDANDPALEDYVFNAENISVHLNGILLVFGEDYSIAHNQMGIDTEHIFTVTLVEPLDPGDIVHLDILFAFAIVQARAGSSQYMVDQGHLYNEIPSVDHEVHWPGVEGAMVMDKDSILERMQKPNTLFVVLSD